MANCLFALGDETAATFHEQVFRALQPAIWELGTFEEGRAHALAIGANFERRQSDQLRDQRNK